MLVVGLDTSESPGGVALLDETGLAAERALPEGLRHAEHLLSTLDALLDACGRTREEIGRLCVNLGPGSFTGLRIGLSAAKGMAQARKAELVGVDGTLAYRERAGDEPRVCVILASRRDLVYARWFSGAHPRTDTVMLRDAELATKLRLDRRPLCLVGSAAQRVASQIGGEGGAFLGPEQALAPSALAVARMGAGLRAARLHGIEPIYVEPILA